jgi:tetrapyrrole methylase family protein/MazG family protein
MNLYPDQHLVKMVHHAGTDDCIIEELPLFEIDRSKLTGMFTVLYLPSLGEQTAFEGLQEIAAHLRAPEGCPWDQEQTLESMRPHILEETYELLNAIDESEAEKVKEEIGDLLLVLTMLIQIGHEEGAFSSAEVVEKISHKLIGRHPHVFSGLNVSGAKAVLENWERIKAQERIVNGQEDKSLLGGVAISLPALSQAQEFQDRAARIGFDWPNIGQVWGKFNEEVVELQEATDYKNRSDEVGDLIFALVNLARWYKVDAESSLRQANKRFRSRFGFIEREARNQGRELLDMSLDEMDSLWEKAKGLQS